jgi:UDP-glucose 4-epimerase
VKRFVFTSSMAVYGNQKPPFDESMKREPEDPYGCGKAYCERMLEIFAETYGFKYTIIRPHNVYGPRQNIYDPYRNVLGIWMNRVMRGKPPIIYGDGKQTRAFSYVEDVTPALANAGFFEEADRQIINLGSDEVVAINDACRIVLEVMKSKLKSEYADARPCEVKHAHCTIKKSQRILGYRTKHTLKSGLEKMAKWAVRAGPQKPTYRLPLEITKKAPKVWLDKLI